MLPDRGGNTPQPPSPAAPTSAHAGTPPRVIVTGALDTGLDELAHALRERCGPGVCIQALPAAQWLAACDEQASAPAQPSTALAVPPMAEQHASATVALTLLMGLDLPCPPARRALQEAQDSALRTRLLASGIDFRVVYGTGAQRISHALSAIEKIALNAGCTSTLGTFDVKNIEDRPVRLRGRPVWSCEKCSDPECEHKLFTALMRT